MVSDASSLQSPRQFEVTTAISNLSNTVIAATASHSLAKSLPDPCLIDVLYSSLCRLKSRLDRHLDGDVQRQLDESAFALALPVSVRNSNCRVVSALFAAPRAHAEESEEEDGLPPFRSTRL